MTRRLTDTSEKALEQLIVRHLAGISEHPSVATNVAQEPVASFAPGGYVLGRASDYNRDLDLRTPRMGKTVYFSELSYPEVACAQRRRFV